MYGALITLFIFFASAFANGLHGRYALPPEETFLVTMRRQDLARMCDCVVDSRNPDLCEQYVKCVRMLPPRILMHYNQCRQSVAGLGFPQCRNSWDSIFPPPNLRPKLFECADSKIQQESPEEKLAIVQAEDCFRDLESRNCMNRPRRYRRF